MVKKFCKKERLVSASGHNNLLFRNMKTCFVIYIVKRLFPFLLLLVSLPSAGQKGNIYKYNSTAVSREKRVSSLSDRQKEFIMNSYYKKLYTPMDMINGKEYESYYIHSKYKPLLFPFFYHTASVITKTIRYNNINLLFDTFLGEIIYTDTSRAFNFKYPQIALNSNYIDGFIFFSENDSLVFRNFRLPECTGKNLKEGYYEVAYEAKSRYLIKHASKDYERDGLTEYKYTPLNLISIGDDFYRIDSRKSLFLLFGKKATDVKEYLHKSGIKVKKADKKQMISILKFYDSLPGAE
jgi:hypothetical protein